MLCGGALGALILELRLSKKKLPSKAELKKTRAAKFARELVSQELGSKLQDFDGIEVFQCDEVDDGVNQSVIVGKPSTS
ncbi:hypothetical protein [Nostoc sp. PCC 7524]|uniref:hypothetical protein n=1 Tax=Nostoc sp. (strain ATCC 29411 / PCC 7524) TaxID=28072 RepID=UPI0005A29D43|nr:hypothetical protein [Nostoc sp. PCC 7524]